MGVELCMGVVLGVGRAPTLVLKINLQPQPQQPLWVSVRAAGSHLAP
jgi:hypothetical protein